MIEFVLMLVQINVMDDNGRVWEFRFDGNNKHYIGWVNPIDDMIFIKENGDVERTRAICNHEIFHVLSDLRPSEDHRIIGYTPQDLPSWVSYPVCDKLIKIKYNS